MSKWTQLLCIALVALIVTIVFGGMIMSYETGEMIVNMIMAIICIEVFFHSFKKAWHGSGEEEERESKKSRDIKKGRHNFKEDLHSLKEELFRKDEEEKKDDGQKG